MDFFAAESKIWLTKRLFLHILLAEINDTVHSATDSAQMDVEREEYHLRSSREESPPAVSGSCGSNGKVRPGVRQMPG